MSRIELDRYARDRVERLRTDLAATRAQSLGDLDEYALCRRIGYVEALAEALLRVLDQGVTGGE
jgi:hypothetical protein